MFWSFSICVSTEVNDRLADHHEDDIAHVYRIVHEICVDTLYAAIDEELETHQKPVQIEEDNGYYYGQKVCSYEKVVNVILMQPPDLVVWQIRIDNSILKVIWELV